MSTSYIPPGYHTLIPYMVVHNAAEAIEFYARAFGARETTRMSMPGSDKVMHAEMSLGDSHFMLSDEYPQPGGCKSPKTVGGISVGLHMYVPDVDAAFKKAVDCGCQSLMPPGDAFWGDRYCRILDPFGHEWSLATHKEDVPPEQMTRRAAEFMKNWKPGH
jgi:PhnB protein